MTHLVTDTEAAEWRENVGTTSFTKGDCLALLDTRQALIEALAVLVEDVALGFPDAVSLLSQLKGES